MTSRQQAQFKTILKGQGHQITRAREVVFQSLLNAEPQTVNEILKIVNGSVDRVSVYRNLDLFERLGITNRIYIGWKYKIELSDEFTAHHHHLSCIACGKIIDINDHTHIDTFITQVTAAYGFEARRHQFEVEGYCRDCQG